MNLVGDFFFMQNAIQMLSGKMGTYIDQIIFLILMLNLFEANIKIDFVMINFTPRYLTM